MITVCPCGQKLRIRDLETRLNAWEGDRTEDGDGWFVYLRDLDGGGLWSAGYQPVPDTAHACSVRYTPGCVTLGRRAADIESSLAVCIAPDADTACSPFGQSGPPTSSHSSDRCVGARRYSACPSGR